eukprot:CAMPEP_0170611698 /NCGR_PEP_ID=MMETSP0224-20130122/23327_1 /TAXON_ID=285029 /ORGANISM="Togula jolla, Strain CCCM 725" /LENGTH=215 /DNA_ID=CAMNT_0010937149 /DNA_START=32 /DNA_END=676 /DNA_ORIENTATION=+
MAAAFITAVQGPDVASSLDDVSRLLEQPPDERLANLERYARCPTVRFRRRGASREEIDLRRLMPASLRRDEEVWEYASCMICLVDFADGEELRRAQCAGGHAFHPKCLRSWLDRSNVTCPVCRGCEEEERSRRGLSDASGNSFAEYITRRMRSKKVDLTISVTNHKRAAKLMRQMREPMPLTGEEACNRPCDVADDLPSDVPDVAAVAALQRRGP